MKPMKRKKCVSEEVDDVFKPRGQLKRDIALAERMPKKVLRILALHLSDERRARIDAVVTHRIRTLSVATEEVVDPHNTAAVIRTAEAFGLQTVHVVEGKNRFFSSRKVTQGTHKWVDLAVWRGAVEFHRAVKTEGKRILIADAASPSTLESIDPAVPHVLVFGNEHLGATEEMRALADGTFSIPMVGFATSVNVSVAAGIAIATLCRRMTGDLSDEEQDVLRARFYLRAVRAGYDIVMREMNSIE